MKDDEVVLLGCGDVGPMFPPLEPYSELVRETFASADICFGQAERLYSTRGAKQVHCRSGHARLDPSLASVLNDCSFDVVSVASNHGMDWGPDALLDTIDVIKGRNVVPIGGGRNLEEACRPAFIERNGVRIAFLAFCSVLQKGYAATATEPGIAPLRAHNYYETFDDQPGVPPRVVTIPYEDDLRRMVEQIAAAKREAHCVVLSLHWGIHFIPRMIADYQWVAAKAAFGAGADVILGHHPHIPKGIDVYNGKVCFFSLGDFLTQMVMAPDHAADFIRDFGVYGVTLDPDPAYARLSHGTDSKRSMIAKVVLSRTGVKKVSYLPVLIDRQLRPEVLKAGDERFDEMVRFIEWSSEGFGGSCTVEGDEVIIHA